MANSTTTIDPRVLKYAELFKGLRSNWKPHEGQITIGSAILDCGVKSVFVQCARKFGKTEFALDILWSIAKLYPHSPCYYIAPLQTQAKEIVWADPRIKEFGPREWLLPGSAGINNSELRLNFTNGSFIKIDGSDNYEKYRGIRYKICVYEEYKDHRPEFRRAMRPNASVLDGWEVFLGTPPEMECDYTSLADEHRTDPKKFFYHAPTWQNPHISREWLINEKKSLYARGEGDVWEREYGANFVPGGASKIFPMVTRSLIKPHAELMHQIAKDGKKLEWIWWADPAAASVFAILFLAYNPYTKDLYLLDEIYETNQAEMTVKNIGKRAIDKKNELWERTEWRQGYDEAETWFLNEFIDSFPDESLEPSHKAANDKDVGLSLIKDIILIKRLHISDRCKKIFWEMDNYYKDKQGKIPKKNDHLIDCLRYILAAVFYSLPEKTEYKEENDENFRGARIIDDFPNMGTNWGGNDDY